MMLKSLLLQDTIHELAKKIYSKNSLVMVSLIKNPSCNNSERSLFLYRNLGVVSRVATKSPGWDGDVELHKGGYWSVSLCAGVGSGSGVGGSAGVGDTDGVVSGSGGGVGSGGGDSDRGGDVGGS